MAKSVTGRLRWGMLPIYDCCGRLRQSDFG
jgi:hypothetical protein